MSLDRQVRRHLGHRKLAYGETTSGDTSITAGHELMMVGDRGDRRTRSGTPAGFSRGLVGPPEDTALPRPLSNTKILLVGWQVLVLDPVKNLEHSGSCSLRLLESPASGVPGFCSLRLLEFPASGISGFWILHLQMRIKITDQSWSWIHGRVDPLSIPILTRS